MSYRLRVTGLLLAVAALAACTAPQPLDRSTLVARGKAQIEQRARDAAAQPAPWTLEAALQRALQSNVDFRMSQLEAAIATGNRKLASMEMLPQLVGEAGYQRRNSLEPSTSTDKDSVQAQLGLTFDVLDFSMAYFRSKELGNQALVAEENRRRVVQGTIRDVAFAWYQSRAYEEIEPDLKALREQVSAALRQSDEIVRLKLGNPMQAIDYRSGLLMVLRRIDGVALQLDQARDELSRQLNLPAGIELRTDPTGAPSMDAVTAFPAVPLPLWHATALVNRPEMRQAGYETRAAEAEAKNRIISALPRLVFRYGTNHDSNSYLVNNDWQQGSVRLSMDLMNLASMPGLRRNLKLKREVYALREEAMAGTVMSQVSVASKSFDRSRRMWCLSHALLDVNRQRSELLGARSQVAAIDPLSYVKATLDSLLLRIESAQQFAEYQRARLTLLQAAGLLDVPAVSDKEALRPVLASLGRGELTSPAQDELVRVAADFGLSRPVFGEPAVAPAQECAP